jgi:signal transduction histidine kinase
VKGVDPAHGPASGGRIAAMPAAGLVVHSAARRTDAGHEALPSPDDAGERSAFFGSSGQPPRERLEWLLAGGRLLFVAGALIASLIPSQRPDQHAVIVTSLVVYLAYSLAVLALVWRPVRFARGWAVALHLFDLAAFSWLTLITEGTPSPFFLSFVFLLIGGTLRWQMWGALATGALSIASLAILTQLLKAAFGVAPIPFDILIVRSTHLAILTGVLGYFGAYQDRFQREIGRLTTWPRRIPEDRPELVREVVTLCAQIFATPRVLLAWEEPGEGHVNLAWTTTSGEVEVRQEPEGTYASLVAPRLEKASFQALDAGHDRRVVYRVDGTFRQCECRPLNDALRARFDISAVQSWPLEGELVHGRLFCLDKRRMEIDELSVGDLVARLTASRLDGLYMLRDVREAAALRERVRLASDLHDSLLQSLAGTGLQLMVSRRLIDRDPERAAKKLDDVQTQIEQGELEMRSFIRRLRPHMAMVSEVAPGGLVERLRNLAARIERQWSVRLRYEIEGDVTSWPEEFLDEAFRIAREGVLNAARHADASVITVAFSAADGLLRLTIADDGRGFPFHGTYDLNALERMNQGPWSLKERVAGLQGNLELTSTDSGSRLLITLRIPVKAG